MIIFRNASHGVSHGLFAVFHPGHVLLSAMVTAAMFKIHSVKKHILTILVVGYFGSIGVATVSDIVIPHFGAKLFGLDIPTHAELHQHEDEGEHEGESDEEHAEHESEGLRERLPIHLGFIEEWYIVNPAALLGIAIAYFMPRTKAPHSAHVLISTWASSSYLLMNLESSLTAVAMLGVLVTLFLAVWLPCCISDIIFPLLFIKSDIEIGCACPYHAEHGQETDGQLEDEEK